MIDTPNDYPLTKVWWLHIKTIKTIAFQVTILAEKKGDPELVAQKVESNKKFDDGIRAHEKYFGESSHIILVHPLERPSQTGQISAMSENNISSLGTNIINFQENILRTFVILIRALV